MYGCQTDFMGIHRSRVTFYVTVPGLQALLPHTGAGQSEMTAKVSS